MIVDGNSLHGSTSVAVIPPWFHRLHEVEVEILFTICTVRGVELIQCFHSDGWHLVDHEGQRGQTTCVAVPNTHT